MRLPDYKKLLAEMSIPSMPVLNDARPEGRILKIGISLIRAHLPHASLGEICTLPDGTLAEVIAVEDKQVLLSPYREPMGLTCGMWVRPEGRQPGVWVGDGLLGRVLDVRGLPLDSLPLPEITQWRKTDCDSPPPLSRNLIDTPFPVGVRAIDATLTIGTGQRTGIFAPAGCGKSTLLGMLSANCDADVIILALIGERGREVREFLEHILTPDVRKRSIVVLATSDRPAMERFRAAATATTIAEYFREQGKQVLLLVDSLTRYARAVREIALAAGEPIVEGGYPPSLYSRLPRLLERAGLSSQGSITAFYTVLMDDENDPLAEEVRSLLDGHIVLSRRLAEAGHYPAIDVLASISRVMPQVTEAPHQKAAGRLRHLLATWKDMELLVRVGEYKQGQDADADEAVARRPAITSLLCQQVSENFDIKTTLQALYEATGTPTD